jgi:hypothetical protein
MAFIPKKTYKIVTTGTHSTIAIDQATYLGDVGSGGKRQVRIATKTVDAAVLFGTSGAAAADTTVATTSLVDGNTIFIAGTVELVDLPHNITHISAEGFAAGPGEVWITLGFGELV